MTGDQEQRVEAAARAHFAVLHKREPLAGEVSLYGWPEALAAADAVSSPDTDREQYDEAVAYVNEYQPRALAAEQERDDARRDHERACVLLEDARARVEALEAALRQARSWCITGANAIEPRNVLGQVVGVVDTALSGSVSPGQETPGVAFPPGPPAARVAGTACVRVAPQTSRHHH